MLQAIIAAVVIGPFAGIFGYAAWIEWERYREHGPAQWGPQGRLPAQTTPDWADEYEPTETAKGERPGQSAKDDRT